MIIRAEKGHDYEAVYAINVAAFKNNLEEADLVETLRQQANPIISLVAEKQGELVGHIMFSPVSLAAHPEVTLMGLGPMAVVPEQQGHGVGSALVRKGLETCKQLGVNAVVVLGHSEYYPRFGFLPSTQFGIDSDFKVPAEFFMVTELQPNALKGISGRVTYHAAFETG